MNIIGISIQFNQPFTAVGDAIVIVYVKNEITMPNSKKLFNDCPILGRFNFF